MLLTSLIALATAAPLGELRTVAVPSAPRALAVVEVGGRPAVFGVGDAGTWIVDPATGAVLASAETSGAAALVEEGAVVICGASGLVRLALPDLGNPSALSAEPCGAIAAFTEGDALRWVTASDVLALWTPRVFGLDGPSRFGTRLTGPPLLASEGDRFAVLGRGESEITERSGFGRSTIAAGGAVGALVAADGVWAWTLPSSDRLEDATHRVVALAPLAGPIGAGDLDGDGRSEIVVAHPGRIGVVRGDAEETVPVLLAPDVLSVADVTGDGCADVLVAASGVPAVGLLAGTCELRAVAASPPAVAPPPDEPAPRVAVPEGALVLDASEPVVHARVGEPLSLQLLADRGEPGAFTHRGGPPDLQLEPSGRLSYTPGPEHVGSWRVSVRMTGGTELLSSRAFWIEVHPADAELPSAGAPPPPPASASGRGPYAPSPFAVRGCSFGFGAAGGISDVRLSWEFLGQEVLPTASPALAVACDGGGPKTSWWVGWDTAPFVVYLIDQNAGVTGRHAVAFTTGLQFGSEALSVGPYGVAGVTLAGLGARGLWLPFQGKGGMRSGFDVRATLFTPSAPAGELTVLYTMPIVRWE